MDATNAEALRAWQRAYAGAPGASQAPVARAQADALAAWQRWHQPWVSARFTADEQPWYALFERARVETLAGLHLPGMQMNLADLSPLAPAAALPNHVYRCARRIWAGETLSATDLGVPATTPSSSPRWFGWRQRPAADQRLQALLLPALQSSHSHLQEAPQFADALRPLIRLLSMTAGAAASPPGLPHPAAPDAEAPLTAPRIGETEDIEQAYRVFSRAWDEVLDARHLPASRAPAPPHAISPAQQAEARRLARRLQQRLLALQVQHWQDEQEHGVLDRRRLGALIASGDARVFRQQAKRLAPQACVSVLLDQSGSMRGLAWALTLQAVDLAVQVLDACGVRSEVLGFSTAPAGDNPLHRAWLAAGCPPSPGRLNAVRHTLYKPTHLPWRRCRQALLRQPQGDGENIDGEALQWAAARLLKQPEPRKILLVFSDGMPFDEATAAANGRGYLEDHLHHSAAAIQAHGIHLAAIGSGQGITRYYRHALVLRQAEQVSALLFEHLADLLTRQR